MKKHMKFLERPTIVLFITKTKMLPLISNSRLMKKITAPLEFRKRKMTNIFANLTENMPKTNTQTKLKC